MPGTRRIEDGLKAVVKFFVWMLAIFTRCPGEKLFRGSAENRENAQQREELKISAFRVQQAFKRVPVDVCESGDRASVKPRRVHQT